MGSGLAAAIAGQDNALQTERQTLSNVYQGLKNQEQEFTSAEAQAKLQDPRYIQMKLSNDMAKFGQETSMNELKSGYDKSTRAVLDLQIAAQQGPDVLQQKALSYLQELGIDPNSEKGQLMLQDPVGFAQKTQQYFAAAATQNTDYQQKYGLAEAKAGWDTADLERQIQSREKIANMQERGQNARHGQTLSTDKQLNEMITRANNGDVAAQQWINTYVSTKRASNPSFGGMTLSPQGGLASKGESVPLPYPNAGSQQPVIVEAGGKKYSFPNQAAADAFKKKAGIK